MEKPMISDTDAEAWAVYGLDTSEEAGYFIGGQGSGVGDSGPLLRLFRNQ